MSKFLYSFFGFLVAVVTPFLYILLIDINQNNINNIILTTITIFFGFIFEYLLKKTDSDFQQQKAYIYWVSFAVGFFVGLKIMFFLIDNITIGIL